MTDDDVTRDEALRAERDAARLRQDAERTASRERAETERIASRARADAERKASHDRADRERTGARHRHGDDTIPVPGIHPELGGYSHVVFDGDRTFYISGQVPVTPAGELAGEDMPTQARQVMENLTAALTAAELDAASIVKLTVFLTDRNDAAAFSEARAAHLEPPLPASSMVVIDSLLDERWKLEVEAIAVKR